MRLRTRPQSDGSAHFRPFLLKRGAKDGGAKVGAERSLQMCLLVSAGEQVHQGGAAVSQTD